jgi:hypothetical protein
VVQTTCGLCFFVFYLLQVTDPRQPGAKHRLQLINMDEKGEKAPLSIFYFNMESWSFPSNHDQAKDAWPNSIPPTYGELRSQTCASLSCHITIYYQYLF